MKHVFKRGLLAAGIALAAQGAWAETMNVTAVAGHPPVFRWVKHLSQTFIPSVNKALEGTDHEINWSEQYGGALAGVGDELEAVEEGLAEVGIVSSLFDPAKLSPQNVTYFTPFTATDPTLISEWVDKMQQDNPTMKAAWDENNLVYLGGATGIDDYLLMTNFPVNSIEDLEGKKIGAPGPAVNWLAGTGAVGVSGNLTTYYNEIKTGVYDGVIVFATAALPGKLYEVAPHVTLVGFGAQYAGGVAANKDWYEGLDPVVQDALMNAGAEMRTAYHQDLEQAAAGALKAMEEQGATITEVDEEFRQKWAEGMDNVAQTWAQSLENQGVPGKEVLKAYMDTMREAGATPVRDWDKE